MRTCIGQVFYYRHHYYFFVHHHIFFHLNKVAHAKKSLSKISCKSLPHCRNYNLLIVSECVCNHKVKYRDNKSINQSIKLTYNLDLCKFTKYHIFCVCMFLTMCIDCLRTIIMEYTYAPSKSRRIKC